MNKRTRAIGCAILAAALYALNAPLSKLLLGRVEATMMAALLYLGAGAGVALMGILRRGNRSGKELPLERKDLLYTVGMVVLDVAAPVFLMMGLSRTTAANASLLNNFEIVATTLIALLVFREPVSRRLWLAIGLVTAASALLSLEDMRSSFSFSGGSLLVLLAACCWGLENNCTRRLSEKDPLQIVVVKGFGSGLGALVVALTLGERFPGAIDALLAMGLGFVAYGLSIFFYIYAQRGLGAARTSAYYAISPFIGTGLSLAIFHSWPSPLFWAALALMVAGAYLSARE